MSACVQCVFRQSLRSAGATPARSPFIRASIASNPARRLISSSTSTQAEKPQGSSSSPAATAKPKSVSSVPAGTVLKGINFNKKLQDPIALPDEEYPEWLWKCLEDRRPRLTTTPQISAEDAADLYSKSKGRRKAAAKRIAAKEAAGVDNLEVPADYKTEDMPSGSYEESQDAIMEAKRASRARRRALIKEKNFLGKLG
ncbi:hypothetical protein H072_4746 [Dactylellina haptotyla CBS 200.50]|uniref:Large ribosomal subunit protein mL54 n=1 Tax=Dactylellina haptotyla (strain CBS 200.50) TaxID=1284197 RepID=S8AEM3_DACHA|nr:hypothetical protein H072_4746 [Dactylellina haptotyla CBS 200.50]